LQFQIDWINSFGVIKMDPSSKNNHISNSMIAEFKEIPTSTFSDVMDSLKINGVIAGLSPIVGGIKLVGTAVPVKTICDVRGTYPLEDFAVGAAIDAASKGDVIFFDLAGEPISTWGGLASQAALSRGIAGVVANGGVRDIEEIQELRYPVFTKHRVPTTGKTRVKMLSINEPIECRRVSISPGDIIVGDSTGVVVIPLKRAEEILQKAKDLEEVEKKFEDTLKQGGSFQEAAKKLQHL
jgi:regulator of RNase E activity RraA